ncbi:MAG TPA: DNA replication/repair protein RecF [Nevskiales bacterium]|nr:DNA replication/repair protein RecF [Nevskiales bacterium]
MHLTELRIRNFRCIAEAELAPGAGINLIIGDNASGKSSLLEAIYFLGRAQSFRGTPSDRLIRSGARTLSVFGRVRNGTGLETSLGVLRGDRHSRIKIGAREDAGIVELVAALPVQVIDPRLHRLLEEGPEQRRRFLDWGVFHVEQGFYPAWLRYQRALRQRNRTLRAAAPAAEVCAWDVELAQQAEQIDRVRRRYLGALDEVLPGIMLRLFDAAAVTVEYAPGWPEGQTLAAALAAALVRDRELGFTHLGPHRADLRIRLHGLQARTRASRGEQKLISAGLLLAQAELLRRRRGCLPLLLIDDLAAELDARSRARLFDAIQTQGAQAFLSFLEPGQIPDGAGGHPMFHVEHGQVRRRA